MRVKIHYLFHLLHNTYYLFYKYPLFNRYTPKRSDKTLRKIYTATHRYKLCK